MKNSKISKKEYNILYKKIFDEISDTLIKGESVKIRKFGTFKLITCKQTMRTNPQTGDKSKIPEKKAVRIELSKYLKNKIQEEWY